MGTPHILRAPHAPGSRVRAPNGAVDGARAVAIEAHTRRFLLHTAKQSGIGDPDSCEIILSLLSACGAIRRSLVRKIGLCNNPEARFSTLVTLYALSPAPATAADLAFHAQVSRSSISEIIKGLEKRGLVAWTRQGRSATIQMTEPGHDVAAATVQHFLQVAKSVAGGIGAAGRSVTLGTFRELERRAASLRP